MLKKETIKNVVETVIKDRLHRALSTVLGNLDFVLQEALILGSITLAAYNVINSSWFKREKEFLETWAILCMVITLHIFVTLN